MALLDGDYVLFSLFQAIEHEQHGDDFAVAFIVPAKSFRLRIASILLVLALYFVASSAVYAASTKQSPPEAETSSLLNSLRSEHSLWQSRPELAYAFAAERVLPHIDAELIAVRLFGRSVLAEADAQKRQALLDAVRAQMLRYVLEAVDAYEHQTLSVSMTRADSLRLQIQSELLPVVNIDLPLVMVAGDWRVVDIIVAGISYTKVKRAQYAAIYSASGIDGVLAHIRNKNSQFFDKKEAANRVIDKSLRELNGTILSAK